MKHHYVVLPIVVLSGIACSPALTQTTGHDPQQHAPAEANAPLTAQEQKPEKAAADKRIGDPYPLGTCPISGEELGAMGEPVIKLYEGREVRFCCESCPPDFEKDLAKSLADLDEAIIKQQRPIYPLKTSLVTGKELPEKPYEFVHGNRLIRLGAESEKAEFVKDTQQYLGKLDEAVITEQSKDYPLKACPVSSKELGSMGDPKNVVVVGRLVRLCCNGCRKALLNDPLKYIAMVDAAKKDAAPVDEASQTDTEHDHGK